MTADVVEEMLPDTMPGGARAVTADLMARLARHYTPPGDLYPGGALVTEVGWKGTGGTRRCDAIYVGFTGTSGRLMVGHEVKASRADWLRELEQRTKADEWERECHAWYVVAGNGIVRANELPDGWGLMTPGRAKVKLTVDVRARTYPERQPSWDAVRSVIARWDTLRAHLIAEAQRATEQKARQERDELIKHWQRALDEARNESDADRTLAALAKALGYQRVDDFSTFARDAIGVPELAPALAEFVRAHRDLHLAARNVLERYGGGFRHARSHLDQAEDALRRIREIADEAPQGAPS